MSEGDIYPASDSVMRFTQALRLLEDEQRQIKAHPKKWGLSRSSVCVDLLLALSQVLPCCDGGGDGDEGAAGQGRHSDAVTALEDVVTLYVEPQRRTPRTSPGICASEPRSSSTAPPSSRCPAKPAPAVPRLASPGFLSG